MDKPLISLITVVLNNKEGLLKTIESIKSQNYHNFEYIVVDGNSTDGTLEIIKNSPIISKWISEKDHGLYDAMNKAIKLADGKYLLFLNSGDCLYSPDTLQKISPILDKNNHPIIYGSAEYRIKSKGKIFSPIDLSNAWKKIPFCHQASFILSTFHKQTPYDLQYDIGADFNLIYNTIKKHDLLKVDQIISSVTPGGISDTRRFQSIFDRFNIINKHEFSLYKNSYYLYLFVDNFIKQTLKLFLPEKITRYLIEKKYNRRHTLL